MDIQITPDMGHIKTALHKLVFLNPIVLYLERILAMKDGS